MNKVQNIKIFHKALSFKLSMVLYECVMLNINDALDSFFNIPREIIFIAECIVWDALA